MRRFVLTFGFLSVAFYVLILLPPCDRALYSYLRANAWLSNGILNGLGYESHVSECTIRSDRFAIVIRRGCDAVEASWLFCAAVFSFSASPAHKLVGILYGTVALQVLNLLRIVSLFCVGARFPRYFPMAHVEIWPAAFVVVTVLLWWQWLRWTRRSRESTA